MEKLAVPEDERVIEVLPVWNGAGDDSAVQVTHESLIWVNPFPVTDYSSRTNLRKIKAEIDTGILACLSVFTKPGCMADCNAGVNNTCLNKLAVLILLGYLCPWNHNSKFKRYVKQNLPSHMNMKIFQG